MIQPLISVAWACWVSVVLFVDGLGLDDLLFFAKNYPKEALTVLEISNHPTAWFSMAIVGITITSFTLQLARSRQLQLYFYTFGISKDVYHELYCRLFFEFAKYWGTHTNPRYYFLYLNSSLDSLSWIFHKFLMNISPK